MLIFFILLVHSTHGRGLEDVGRVVSFAVYSKSVTTPRACHREVVVT